MINLNLKRINLIIRFIFLTMSQVSENEILLCEASEIGYTDAQQRKLRGLSLLDLKDYFKSYAVCDDLTISGLKLCLHSLGLTHLPHRRADLLQLCQKHNCKPPLPYSLRP